MQTDENSFNNLFLSSKPLNSDHQTTLDTCPFTPPQSPKRGKPYTELDQPAHQVRVITDPDEQLTHLTLLNHSGHKGTVSKE